MILVIVEPGHSPVGSRSDDRPTMPSKPWWRSSSGASTRRGQAGCGGDDQHLNDSEAGLDDDRGYWSLLEQLVCAERHRSAVSQDSRSGSRWGWSRWSRYSYGTGPRRRASIITQTRLLAHAWMKGCLNGSNVIAEIVLDYEGPITATINDTIRQMS